MFGQKLCQDQEAGPQALSFGVLAHRAETKSYVIKKTSGRIEQSTESTVALSIRHTL